MEQSYTTTQQRTVSAERFSAIVEAYGADSSRWPEAEREFALILLDRSAQAQEIVRNAQALDQALGASRPVPTPLELYTRAMRGFDKAVQRRRTSPRERMNRIVEWFRDAVWPGAPVWKPTAAFALSLLLGAAAGVLVPQEVAARDNEVGMNLVGDYSAPVDVDQVDR